MLDYTLDILLIGFVVVLVIQLIKAPIKSVLENKGLSESSKMAKTFNAIMTLFSYAMCFAGACVYLSCIKNYPVFEDTKILTYTVGTAGASQTIYKTLETYGRDGLLAIIDAIIDRIQNPKLTDPSKLSETSIEEVSKIVMEGIEERFENPQITAEDVADILKDKLNHS